MKRRKWFLPLSFLSVVIVVGALAYFYLEGWSLLDSFYFVIVTLTTVGYGDLVPLTNGGKIFTMFFSIVSIACALYFFSLIGSSVFEKHVDKKVTEIKKGAQKEQEVKEEIKKEIRKVRGESGKKN